MYCNNCGLNNPDGATFCNRCGNRLTFNNVNFFEDSFDLFEDESNSEFYTTSQSVNTAVRQVRNNKFLRYSFSFFGLFEVSLLICYFFNILGCHAPGLLSYFSFISFILATIFANKDAYSCSKDLGHKVIIFSIIMFLCFLWIDGGFMSALFHLPLVIYYLNRCHNNRVAPKFIHIILFAFIIIIIFVNISISISNINKALFENNSDSYTYSQATDTTDISDDLDFYNSSDYSDSNDIVNTDTEFNTESLDSYIPYNIIDSDKSIDGYSYMTISDLRSADGFDYLNGTPVFIIGSLIGVDTGSDKGSFY